MSQVPEPPKAFKAFTARYPVLAEAWDLIGQAALDSGPLDARTVRLVKLGIAIGAGLEGPVHASARKSLAMGITPEEIEQVVAAAAGTVGMPSSVAAFTWVRDVLDAPRS